MATKGLIESLGNPGKDASPAKLQVIAAANVIDMQSDYDRALKIYSSLSPNDIAIFDQIALVIRSKLGRRATPFSVDLRKPPSREIVELLEALGYREVDYNRGLLKFTP